MSNSNYTEAQKIAGFEPNEWNAPAFAQGQVLATLALIDEMRETRGDASSEVFVLQKYNPLLDTAGVVVDVYRNRDAAFAVRDELNEVAFANGQPVRYIVKEKTLK